MSVVSDQSCQFTRLVRLCHQLHLYICVYVSVCVGCQLLVYPGAFNMTTGPAHWELLARARAIDNQCYVATVSPARDVTASYVAWGHSLVVNPWSVHVLDHETHINAQFRHKLLLTCNCFIRLSYITDLTLVQKRQFFIIAQ